jgi:hypothetical protein
VLVNNKLRQIIIFPLRYPSGGIIKATEFPLSLTWVEALGRWPDNIFGCNKDGAHRFLKIAMKSAHVPPVGTAVDAAWLAKWNALKLPAVPAAAGSAGAV